VRDKGVALAAGTFWTREPHGPHGGRKTVPSAFAGGMTFRHYSLASPDLPESKTFSRKIGGRSVWRVLAFLLLVAKHLWRHHAATC
jgi:hypothetical protein